ncbi:hypothetical protein K470DRAFT_279481 [Piedraia hortae CBS 480.64]|uniref:Uncharacterized protein n=1 Tax=Piedraia hortae CBS 480.64 TaxID=1314780 RepID=A0A6A7BP60_9PEZI|nr:hypothetical protein K470DRAFT_279481 [Piedraia hortae CBS 480.64]
MFSQLPLGAPGGKPSASTDSCEADIVSKQRKVRTRWIPNWITDVNVAAGELIPNNDDRNSVRKTEEVSTGIPSLVKFFTRISWPERVEYMRAVLVGKDGTGRDPNDSDALLKLLDCIVKEIQDESEGTSKEKHPKEETSKAGASKEGTPKAKIPKAIYPPDIGPFAGSPHDDDEGDDEIYDEDNNEVLETMFPLSRQQSHSSDPPSPRSMRSAHLSISASPSMESIPEALNEDEEEVGPSGSKAGSRAPSLAGSRSSSKAGSRSSSKAGSHTPSQVHAHSPISPMRSIAEILEEAKGLSKVGETVSPGASSDKENISPQGETAAEEKKATGTPLSERARGKQPMREEELVHAPATPSAKALGKQSVPSEPPKAPTVLEAAYMAQNPTSSATSRTPLPNRGVPPTPGWKPQRIWPEGSPGILADRTHVSTDCTPDFLRVPAKEAWERGYFDPESTFGKKFLAAKGQWFVRANMMRDVTMEDRMNKPEVFWYFKEALVAALRFSDKAMTEGKGITEGEGGERLGTPLEGEEQRDSQEIDLEDEEGVWMK